LGNGYDNGESRFIWLDLYSFSFQSKVNDWFRIQNAISSDSGFTVLKGAMIPIQTSPIFVGKKKRDEKLKLNSIMVDKETVKLERDLTFKSPSAAASFCYGKASNGWATWVNDTGQTLDEVYRNAQNKVI
jgi:hypothetical protein